MSLLGKIKKAVIKGSKYLPALAAAVPSSKALAGAAQAFQTGATIAQGGGLAAITGAMPSPGAMPMSLQAGNFPAFPSLPGGSGGGIVKTGLPMVAAAAGTAIVRAAPAIAAGARSLLARVSPRVAKALGWVTVGGLVYDAAGNLQGQVKRRQMNPLNPRAARRAVRRIKSVRKLCSSIERTLPKQKSRCKR